MFRILRLATISAMLVTAVACLVSYEMRSSECNMVIAQQKHTTGYAINWNRALSEAGPNANLSMDQLQNLFPQDCDPNTKTDLLNCGLLGIIVFSILFIPLALARFAYRAVRD